MATGVGYKIKKTLEGLDGSITRLLAFTIVYKILESDINTLLAGINQRIVAGVIIGLWIIYPILKIEGLFYTPTKINQKQLINMVDDEIMRKTVREIVEKTENEKKIN